MHEGNCKTLGVEMDICRVDFIRRWTEEEKKDGKHLVANAIVMKPETVRGEVMLVNVNKTGEVLSVELINPGEKPCQPTFRHFDVANPETVQ